MRINVTVAEALHLLTLVEERQIDMDSYINPDEKYALRNEKLMYKIAEAIKAEDRSRGKFTA